MFEDLEQKHQHIGQALHKVAQNVLGEEGKGKTNMVVTEDSGSKGEKRRALCLEAVLKEWRSCQGMGIPIGTNTLFTLNLTNNEAIFAQDICDIEFMLQRIYPIQE